MGPIEELKLFSYLSNEISFSSKLDEYQRLAFKENKENLVEIYIIFWDEKEIYDEEKFKIYEFTLRDFEKIRKGLK